MSYGILAAHEMQWSTMSQLACVFELLLQLPQQRRHQRWLPAPTRQKADTVSGDGVAGGVCCVRTHAACTAHRPWSP